MSDDERIPLLTPAERAELFGTGYREQMDLERAMPWIRHWSAMRFGAAADRTRSWLAAGRPGADHEALLVVAGDTDEDRAIAATVRETVAALPVPAAWHLVHNVIIKCGAACDDPIDDANGWLRETLPGAERPFEIGLLVPRANTFAHEAAHAYQTAKSPWVTGLDREQRTTLVAVIRAGIGNEGDSSVRDLEAMMMQSERAADELATAWGFAIDTTSGCAGERRRRGLREMIAAAVVAAAPSDTDDGDGK